MLKGEERPEENISEDEKRQMMYEYHDAPLGGHRGMNEIYTAIRGNYSWPNMKQEIEEYVKRCKSYQVNKVLGTCGKAPMVIKTTARQPFEKCCLDIIGQLAVTQEGNKYFLTFQDNLSKFLVAIPIPWQDVEMVAKESVKHVILRVGTPKKLLTNQGSIFLSEVFRNTCKLLKIKKLQMTQFHPETNGSLKRSHRVLKEYLRHCIKEDQSNWDEWVSYGTCVQHIYPHIHRLHAV